MTQKRNLLIVLAHGLRSDCLSDEREWPLKTPHLETMAEQGLRLVLSSATPADPGGLVSLLTGQHARQHGVLRDDAPTPTLRAGLPLWLAEAGYHTVGVGEVGAIASCLDEALVTEGVAVPEPAPNRCWYTAAARSRGHAPALAQQRRTRLRTGPLAPDRLMLDPEEDIDGFIANQAEEAIARLPEDRPWAMIVAFSGPGNDLPPPLHFDRVVESARLTTDFVPARLETLDALVEPELPRSVLQRLEPQQIARIRADYLGRVSLIDHGVGKLRQAVEKRRDADRDWSVFTADRGCLLGEHGLVGHRSFLAPAIEVPLIVTPPAGDPVPPPDDKFPDGLFSTVDVAPTVAALAGADRPESLAGRSLLPLFQGHPVLPEPTANLSEFHDRTLIETERFKAVFNVRDRRCLGLYDLVADPEEQANLIERNTPATRKLVKAMRLKAAETLLPLRS
jgi:arylsulfatase A-like enzyme